MGKIGKDLQLRMVNGDESLEELRQKMLDNTIRTQTLLNGLTGDTLETWTPYQTDGSLPVRGNVVIEDGELQLGPEGGRKGAFRKTWGGLLEWTEEMDLWERFERGQEEVAGSDDATLRVGHAWVNRVFPDDVDFLIVHPTETDITIYLPETPERLMYVKKMGAGTTHVIVKSRVSGYFIDSALEAKLDDPWQCNGFLMNKAGNHFSIVSRYP